MIYDSGNKSLNLLDINITNVINSEYELKSHSKKSITNIHIKPISCIDPNIIKSVFKGSFHRVFKGFLHREHSTCSEKHIKEKEKFLIGIFVENGRNKQFLKNLVVESKG